jgi:hypothetical protein
MRTFAAFASLTMLAVSGWLFFRIGGWQMLVAVAFLVAAIHLEIGLRCDEIFNECLRIMRLIEQYLSGSIRG